MSNLKPCRYCGGKGEIYRGTADGLSYRYYAHCDDCAASTEFFSDYELAEEAWNDGRTLKTREICAYCGWFALEPGKQRSGACLKYWIPNEEVDHPTREKILGAYGRTLTWFTCEDWTGRWSVKRLEPEVYHG